MGRISICFYIASMCRVQHTVKHITVLGCKTTQTHWYLQRHVLKLLPQTPYKMWPAAEALRRIERRLEMMIGAQTAVYAPETNSAHAQEVQLDLRNMQDDGDLLPQIKHKIGQKTASSFHCLQHLHSDPKCVLLCSSGAHRCDCSRPGRFLCM